MDTRAQPDRELPRVLIVGQGPPTTGGIPSFIRSLLANGWLRRQARLEYLNTTPSRAKRPGAASIANLIDALGHAVEVFRRSRRADVVHLNLAPAPVLPLLRALVLSLAARAGGARVLLHAHTGRMHIAARSRLYRAVLRRVLRVVDALIVVSESAEDVADALGGTVWRLENGVDASLFRTGPKAEPPPVLVFVGTVCERKGLIDLRDALRRVPKDGPAGEVRVKIVGDSAQEGPGVFERVVRAFGQAGLDEVEFLGPRSHEEIRELLASGSIFCLPSHWEGFPLSLLEAMASGMAVIATNVGDIPRMLDEGRAGVLVDPGDVRAIATAIQGLLLDPEQRARFGQQARQRVEQEFTEDRQVRALARLYAGEAAYSM